MKFILFQKRNKEKKFSFVFRVDRNKFVGYYKLNFIEMQLFGGKV